MPHAAPNARQLVARYDAGETLQKPQRREDGSVIVEAYATRAGVFPYRMADGSVVNELRHPDDVFDPESMATLALRPYTDGHPYENVAKVDGEEIPGLVDASSARTYSRGIVTEKVWRDGNKLACRVVILDAELAASVLAGDKAETSCGYTAATVAESGTWEGIPYQHRQKRIRYNHLAAVEHGRAGPDVRARLDALDGAMVRNPTPSTPAAPTPPGVPTVKLDIGGISGDVPDHMAQAYQRETQVRADELARVTKERDELKTTLSKEKARADQAEEAKTQIKAKLDAATDPVARRKEIADRARLEGIVRKVLGKKAKLDGTDDELRLQVIAAKSKAKLDEADAKNPVYVRARFDGLVADHKLDEGAPTFPPGGDGSETPEEKKKEGETMPPDGKTDEGDEITTDGTGGSRLDADDPQAAYMKTLAGAWQPKAATK